MTTEKTSSPRRSGADWFGLVAFAVLVICSAVLVVRLISTKFLPTGQLLLAVGALLVLSGLHGWVQLPHREKTGGKIACGIVALVLAAAMLYGAVALGSVQHAITDVADKSVETDITCVIVNADDPAQSLDDVKGYRFGILEDRDTENTQSLLQQLQEKLGAAEHTAYASPALLTDALYDDQVGAILLNKGYIPLLEEQEGYADFSDRTRILYEYTTTKTVEPTPADTNAPVDVTKDPFVVYCSGIDARSSNINITSRSDVNILAVVNPTTRQILLVNTPRDYYLPLAHNGQLDKLTHAGIYGTGESMQTYQPDLGMIGMPYLIQSDEQMEKVLTGEVGQEFEGLMEACGMKCLGYFTRGPRYITSTKKITSVADCNNLVIRTPQSAMTVAAFQALGAKPTPMALSEVFTSLQQGTIEAQENPLAMIETQSFYEVCPYLILTAHLRAWVYIAMGLAQYNRLSDSQKAVVDQAGAECQAYEHELFLDNEEKYYNQLQEQGMEFIEVDTDAFAKAMIDGVLPILTDSQKKIYDAIAALA